MSPSLRLKRVLLWTSLLVSLDIALPLPNCRSPQRTVQHHNYKRWSGMHRFGRRPDPRGLTAFVQANMPNKVVAGSTPLGWALRLRSTSSETFSTTTTFDDEASSSKFVKSYRLDGVGCGSRVDISTNTGHSLTTDVPLKMGGQDSAPQPVETLLAAWMGCTQATALFVGRQMKPTRVLIDRLEFDNIQGFRDERGALQLPIDSTPNVPSRLQRITGTIRIFLKKGKAASSTLSPTELQLLKEQTEARCPVANMIAASGCDIDVSWTLACESM
ncbi:OsmC-like protein [Nitzschia inconspicua]|uniref:OsmC-like protein n=1 Tax=Nitzschia inconspicua TaxID=303405 RepID=A0A9K3PGN1_9STRA|nr:OsmC-like protein [Nitzschia inconspicua]